MTPISVRNAKYTRHGAINCIVEFEEMPGEQMPFSAVESDVVEHGRQLYKDLAAGKYGAVAAYTDDDLRADEINDRSALRARKIAEADDVIRPLSDERDAEIISDADLKRWKAWVKYRKALRELDVESVADVKWPSQPQ